MSRRFAVAAAASALALAAAAQAEPKQGGEMVVTYKDDISTSTRRSATTGRTGR